MRTRQRVLDFIRFVTLSEKWRMIRHVEYLKEHVTFVHAHDQENFEHIYRNFKSTSRRLTVYNALRATLFALLYISVIAAYVRDLAPFADEFLRPLIAFASIFGFTVLTVFFLIASKLVHAVMIDLHVEHTHLVALLVKNNKDFVIHPHYKWGVYQELD